MKHKYMLLWHGVGLSPGDIFGILGQSVWQDMKDQRQQKEQEKLQSSADLRAKALIISPGRAAFFMVNIAADNGYSYVRLLRPDGVWLCG